MDDKLSYIFSLFLAEKDQLSFNIRYYITDQFILFGSKVRKVDLDFLEKNAKGNYTIKGDIPAIDFIINFVNDMYYFFTYTISGKITDCYNKEFDFEGRICIVVDYKHDGTYKFYGFRLVTEHSLEEFKRIQNGRFTVSRVQSGNLTKSVR